MGAALLHRGQRRDHHPQTAVAPLFCEVLATRRQSGRRGSSSSLPMSSQRKAELTDGPALERVGDSVRRQVRALDAGEVSDHVGSSMGARDCSSGRDVARPRSTPGGSGVHWHWREWPRRPSRRNVKLALLQYAKPPLRCALGGGFASRRGTSRTAPPRRSQTAAPIRDTPNARADALSCIGTRLRRDQPRQACPAGPRPQRPRGDRAPTVCQLPRQPRRRLTTPPLRVEQG